MSRRGQSVLRDAVWENGERKWSSLESKVLSWIGCNWIAGSSPLVLLVAGRNREELSYNGISSDSSCASKCVAMTGACHDNSRSPRAGLEESEFQMVTWRIPYLDFWSER